ncbi:hypothetical protein BJY00DRAFT_320325 [Aspergillus carlsbadensis]|nr:hypothetical protein BJY00DRAFT_320325 [Aspergillus carlsbadensis]
MPALETPEPRARARAGVRVRVVHTFVGAGQIIEDMWSASPSLASSSPCLIEAGAGAGAGAEAVAEVEAEVEVEAWQMPAMEQACLEFYIKLLNQHHYTHEYKSALVCAMAMQG